MGFSAVDFYSLEPAIYKIVSACDLNLLILDPDAISQFSVYQLFRANKFSDKARSGLIFAKVSSID